MYIPSIDLFMKNLLRVPTRNTEKSENFRASGKIMDMRYSKYLNIYIVYTYSVAYNIQGAAPFRGGEVMMQGV